MDISYILEESGLLNHTKEFGFPLQAGIDECTRQLQTGWSSSSTLLQTRAEDVQRLRAHPEICTKIHSKLDALQASETLLRSHTHSEISKTAEGQILFQGTHTKILNTIPYMLSIFIFLKIWIAPILALLTPLLLAVMPYVIMTTVMDMKLTWEMYTTMMKHMVLGIQNGEPWRPKHYVQAIWTAASLGQGIVTPFMTAFHTSNLDQTIVKRGQALISLAQTAQSCLQTVKSIGCFQNSHLIVPDVPDDPRQAAAWMESEPLGMQIIWRILGRVSILVTLAKDDSWTSVQWSKDQPMVLSNCFDLAIPNARAVPSTVTLRGHSLLTGPNRGGKSSSLRAILQQVILGQTFGMTKDTIGSWKPFRQVFTRLKSRDHAGKESLFEMEVRMASTILRTIQSRRVHSLVLIDELFHSTNPPDAEISARLFLQQLWKQTPVCTSIISTHIFSLCEGIQQTAESEIQLLCCPAEETPDGIQYSYKLQSGICRTSSVREVLRENGLLV